jgi:hypothetical protein
MLLMLLTMLAFYFSASLLSAMTSLPALKKPWRALKLRIRASTTRLSGRKPSNDLSEEETPVDEERGEEDETSGLMGMEAFEVTMT